MRTLTVVLALAMAACESSPAAPVDDASADPCEPMPYCEAFKNDVVREPMTTLSASDTVPSDTLPPLP